MGTIKFLTRGFIMTRKFYSRESVHGSSTSHGFNNDILVKVFANKHDRDYYVSNSNNISCYAITRNDVTKEAANLSLTDNRIIKPNVFQGEYWAVLPIDKNEHNIIGIIGIADIYRQEERFYK